MNILVKVEDTHGMTEVICGLNRLLLPDYSNKYSEYTNNTTEYIAHNVEKHEYEKYEGDDFLEYRVCDSIIGVRRGLGFGTIRLDKIDISFIKRYDVSHVVFVYDMDARLGSGYSILTAEDISGSIKELQQSAEKYSLLHVEFLFSPVVYCAETVMLNYFNSDVDYGDINTSMDFATIVHRYNTPKLHTRILNKILCSELSEQECFYLRKRVRGMARTLNMDECVRLDCEYILKAKDAAKIFRYRSVCVGEELCRARRHENVLLWMSSILSERSTQNLLTKETVLEFHEWLCKNHESICNGICTNDSVEYRGYNFSLIGDTVSMV